jgi:hypothetical protein
VHADMPAAGHEEVAKQARFDAFDSEFNAETPHEPCVV